MRNTTSTKIFTVGLIVGFAETAGAQSFAISENDEGGWRNTSLRFGYQIYGID